MSTFEKIIDRIWAAQNQSQQAEEAVQKKKQQITAPKTEKAPATKPVQTAQSTDTRTTAQKAADSKASYTAYQGSEEQKKNQGEANKKALQEVMDRLFAVPNTSMGEMPLQVAAPVPVDQKREALKAEADYHAGQLKMEQDKAMMDADLAEYQSWSEQDKANMEQYLADRDRHQSNIFGEPQFDTYNLNPLFQTKDPAKVRQMAESIQRSRNAQAMEQATAAADQLAQEHPVLGSAASVATNLASAYTGPVEIAKEMANRTGRYQTMDPNNLGGIGQQFGGTVRQNVTERIQGDGSSPIRQVAALGYNAGMSVADNLARRLAGGLTPDAATTRAASALAATGTFTDAVRQYSAQGAEPGRAMMTAAAVAAIDYLTNKYTLEKLIKIKPGDWAGFFAQTFAFEPSEELTSLIGGMAAEAVILGKSSPRKQRIGEMVAHGMSLDEAKKQVNKELLLEVGNTYLSSVLSGAGMAGIEMAGKGISQLRQPTQQEITERAIAELGAELTKNMPAEQPVQLTEGQRAMQQAADEVVGVKPVEQTAAEVAGVEPTQAESAQAEVIRENVKNNLWKNYRGKQDDDGQVSDGWQAVTDNSVWATALAMKEVNPDYFNAYMDSAENEQLSPIIDAVINAAEDVRQESISPMAAATVINEVFEQHGERGLQQMYNPRNGNLYDSALNRMKAVDSTRGKVDADLDEEARNVKGTGAAEQNFSGKAEYQDLLYEGNVQPDRAGDVRPMEVPKTDTAGNPVSEVAANVYGSQYTPDDLASETESAIARGELSYITITNDEAAERATQKIEAAGGWREAYTQWHDEVRDGKTSAEMAARGAMLLNHAAEVYEQTKATGDEAATKAAKQEWLSVLLDVREMGTNTAQGLQAMRMIRDLAPPDKLDFAIASIRRMVADMKLQGDVKIDEHLLNEYRMAETDEQRDEIMTEIQQNVADQIPSTFLDKWTALRYMNMLGNLKTNVRNVAGNVGSMVMYRIKDQVATAVERLAGTERTKSSIVGRELLQACKDDFDHVKTTVNSGGKYNERMASSDEFRQGVMDKRQIFKNPVAEGYRKATNWMMNNQYFGDEAFGRAAYARALAGYLKAKGYDAAAVQNGSIDDKVMNEARAYAIREAQEATFHDNSKLAEIATRMQRATGVVGQGIMPFTKTPANVLTRAVEFSPLGIVDTAVKAAKKAAGNQEITGADIVNSAAKTLTGTALVVLGALMKDQGLLSGGPDEDEEKAKFDEMMGMQNYALTLPNGTSYTIDWLTPAAMPIFMGAQLWDIISNTDDFTFADVEKVFTSIADPMVQMSMLQGLNDSLDSIKYAENNLGQFFINSAVSYLTQGLTNTLLGQIERSTEENRQTTYIDKDSNTPQWLQRQLGKASQKIPGWDYQQTDYLNAFGETEKNEGGLLYNLLSPGYLSKERQTAVTEELYRLREATGMNVFPQPVEKQLTYTDTNGTKHIDHNLTQEQFEKMQTTEGQTAAKLLDKMISSPDFKALSDQQKAYAFDAVYQYAQEQGKKAAISDYHSEADAWIKEVADGDISAFIKRGASGPLRNAVDNTVAAISNGWKVTGADKKAMEETYSSYTKLSDEAKQQVRDGATGDTDKYLKVRDAGVDTASYIKAVEAVKALKPEGEHKDVVPGQRWEAALEGGTTNKAKDALVKAYMDDYDPESSSPDKTELKYEYLRQELNRSPEKAVAIMRVQQDGDNKDEKMAGWAALGYTPAECDILWNLFGTTSKTKAIDVVSWHNSKTE